MNLQTTLADEASVSGIGVHSGRPATLTIRPAAEGTGVVFVRADVTDRDAAPKAADYHNWSEFHVDGAWRLVDCQKRRLMAPAQDYVTFRVATNAEMSPIGRAHRYRVEGELVVTM